MASPKRGREVAVQLLVLSINCTNTGINTRAPHDQAPRRRNRQQRKPPQRKLPRRALCFELQLMDSLVV